MKINSKRRVMANLAISIPCSLMYIILCVQPTNYFGILLCVDIVTSIIVFIFLNIVLTKSFKKEEQEIIYFAKRFTIQEMSYSDFIANGIINELNVKLKSAKIRNYEVSINNDTVKIISDNIFEGEKYGR